MANISKIGLIIEKLLEKTNSAEVKWSRAGQSNSYLARLDDYSFQLSGPSASNILATALTAVVLEILRNDGTAVARVSTELPNQVNAFTSNRGTDLVLYGSHATSLRTLFQIVSSGDSELDAILKSLK